MRNKYMKISRLKALCKVEFRREYIQFLLIGLLYILLVWSRYPLGMRTVRRLSVNELPPDLFGDIWLTFCIYVIVLYCFSCFMSPLKSPRQRGFYLMCPVSLAEKFLTRFLVVAYIPFICIVFSFWYLPKGFDFVSTLCLTASVGMLCSVLWPKYTFLKILLGYLLFTLLRWIICYYVAGISWGWTGDSKRQMVSGPLPWIFSPVVASWLNIAFAVFNVTITYFRLRKTDERMNW